MLGGFSQGSMMSYALGLGAGRPRPAGLIALSGLLPDRSKGSSTTSTRRCRRSRSATARSTRSSESSGAGRRKELLEGAGADVLYREYPLPHTVDPSFLAELRRWLERVASEAASSRVGSVSGASSGCLCSPRAIGSLRVFTSAPAAGA